MKNLMMSLTLIFTIFLTGCAANNNENKIIHRNRTTVETPNVKYDSPNHGGPAMTGVDVSDPKLDKDKHQNIKGFRKNLKKENFDIK